MKKSIGIMSSATAIVFSLFGFANADEELSRQDLYVFARLNDPTRIDMALPKKFAFPDDARASSIFGIDVSHHTEDGCNCTISWDDVIDANIKFVYFKASQGTRFRDKTAVNHKDSVRKLQSEGKLRVGYYHFLNAADDAGKQAENFLAVIQPDVAGDLPPSVDLEWNAGPYTNSCPSDAIMRFKGKNGQTVLKCDMWSAVKADDIIAKLNTFIGLVKDSTGSEPLLYTNRAWWTARVGDVKRIHEVNTSKIWIADYSTSGLATENPRTPDDKLWHLWQFSETAKIKISGKNLAVDANISSTAFDDEIGSGNKSDTSGE